MRDRLIELIESARYWGAGTSAEIADRLLAAEFVATWISVDDELPDCFCGGYNDFVLVCTIDGTVDTAWCRNGSWFPTSRERDANDTLAVTHWMPLPEPPKERIEL